MLINEDLDFYFVKENIEIIKNTLDEFIITKLYYLVLQENKILKKTIWDNFLFFLQHKILIHFKKNSIPF